MSEILISLTPACLHTTLIPACLYTIRSCIKFPILNWGAAIFLSATIIQLLQSLELMLLRFVNTVLFVLILQKSRIPSRTVQTTAAPQLTTDLAQLPRGHQTAAA
jgi:hypothetical protein